MHIVLFQVTLDLPFKKKKERKVVFIVLVFSKMFSFLKKLFIWLYQVLIVVHRLSNFGMRAELLCDMWNLPGPGIKPTSPVCQGRILTTRPLGKFPRRFQLILVIVLL